MNKTSFIQWSANLLFPYQTHYLSNAFRKKFEKPQTYRLHHWTEVIILALSIARMFNIIYAVKHQTVQLAYDPVAALLQRLSKIFGVYFIASNILFVLFALLLQMFYHLSLSTRSLAAIAYYDLVCNSTEYYRKSCKSKSEVELLRKIHVKNLLEQVSLITDWTLEGWVAVLLEKTLHPFVVIWMNIMLENVNLEKMFSHRLSLFPTLSSKVRVRLMRMLMMGNYLFSRVMLFTGK